MSLGSLAQDNEGEGDPAFSDDVPFEARARFERDRGFALPQHLDQPHAAAGILDDDEVHLPLPARATTTMSRAR